MADESGKISELNTTEEFPNEAEDRISALPDSLLLHILSFLSTIEVVRTCLLSQRWRFLWTDISEIHWVEESEDITKVCRFVDWIGRMLVAFDGKWLKKFSVDFCYDKCFASNVNSWVQFVVKNKVKNITLRCRDLRECEYEYKLSQVLYSHSSMTSLTVCCTDMAPRGAIMWGSLKSLSLEEVGLEECLMEKIFSGCPVLEALHLKECWGLSCLNIMSPSLATLSIEDWELYDSEEDVFLEISAPYVLDLSIIESNGVYEFKLMNVSSVVRAKLKFDSTYFEEDADPSAMDYMKELLESLRSVKELKLGPWCVEVLSMLEAKGWQLPPSTRQCLILNVWALKRSIAGILAILRSSPKLERLVIKGKPFPFMETRPYYSVAAYLRNANLDLVLSNVKTVKFTSFKESFLPGKPMATLALLLIKGATTALEKIVICAE